MRLATTRTASVEAVPSAEPTTHYLHIAGIDGGVRLAGHVGWFKVSSDRHGGPSAGAGTSRLTVAIARDSRLDALLRTIVVPDPAGQA